MSLLDQELRAMRLAWELLLEISGGRIPVDVRQRAKDASRHFPLGGDATTIVLKCGGDPDALHS